MLKAEMGHHLGSAAEEGSGNHRNGYGQKTVITRHGQA
jgi:transposase-like protein